VSSVDPAAIKVLIPVYKLYLKKGIQTLFVGCTSPNIEIMDRCGFISAVGIENLFPTVHDAVIHCMDSSYNGGFDHLPLSSNALPYVNNNSNEANPELKFSRSA
jgi:hypothetical protein